MKVKNVICKALVAMCVLTGSVVLVSCQEDVITITALEQNTEFKVNPTEICMGYGKGDMYSIHISCSDVWRLSEVPEWIGVSANSGNGSSYVSLTTKEANSSAHTRTGRIKVSNSEKDIYITINQSGSALSNCEVRPNHTTTTTDGIAFDLSCQSNVARYYRGYIETSKVDLLSTSEILNYIETNFTRHLPSEDEVVAFTGLKPNTQYSIYTVGYDREGNRGELVSTKIRTAVSKNNPACAWVGEITGNSSYWYWNVTKSATCNSYYMMTTENSLVASASDVVKAWWIEDAARTSLTTEYVNGGQWQQRQNGSSLCVWTRGITTNGEFEGTICKAHTGSLARNAIVNSTPNEPQDCSTQKLSPEQYKLYKAD